MIPNLGKGGNNLWLSDGFCDDANNIEECNYDGGDCCGINVQNNFCVNCTCTGRCKYALSVSNFASLNSFLSTDKLDCYSDASCHGVGFCRQGRCMCPSEYNYKKDCSIYGCKFIL